MRKEKMLRFGSGENAVEVAVTVSSYKVGERLYIGLYSLGDAGLEPFSNLTINLPYSPAGVNEGYIERNDCKNLVEFIERYQLGRILPEKGYSGYAEYVKAAFDLDKLAEYDPAGVESYRYLHRHKWKDQTVGKNQMDGESWMDGTSQAEGKEQTEQNQAEGHWDGERDRTIKRRKGLER